MKPAFLPQDRLEVALIQALIAGLAFSLLLPALHRSGAFGWPPLWLVGLPLAAWFGLRVARWRDGAGALDASIAAARPRRRAANAQATRRRLPARGGQRRHRQSA